MVASLVMGGVVCTALSMAGGFIADLKIGYWLGSTPAKQQTWKFLGTLVSAATVGGVIMILNKTYGFASGALAAPQANAMAAVIDADERCGSSLAVVRNRCGTGACADLLQGSGTGICTGYVHSAGTEPATGSGGAINWYVTTRSKDEAVNAARGEKGTCLHPVSLPEEP